MVKCSGGGGSGSGGHNRTKHKKVIVITQKTQKGTQNENHRRRGLLILHWLVTEALPLAMGEGGVVVDSQVTSGGPSTEPGEHALP